MLTPEQAKLVRAGFQVGRSMRQASPSAAMPRPSTTKPVQPKPKTSPNAGRNHAAVQEAKGTHDMTEKTLDQELAEVKRELHEHIRERAATMTPADRKRIKPEHRKLFEQITRDVEPGPRVRIRPNPDFEKLDREWNLTPPPAAVTRTPHQMVLNAFGSTQRKSAPSSPLVSSPPRMRAGELYPRSTSTTRVTNYSDAAAEMDRRMGIEPARK